MSESRFAIWGNAGHAKVLGSLIALLGGRVLAVFDQYGGESVLAGVPLFVGEADFAHWADTAQELGDIVGLVAIGGSRGRDRIAVQQRFALRGLRQSSLVHPSASVCASARLGAGTQVLAQAVVAADAWVGEACIVNHRASIDHECKIGQGVHLAPGATLCGLVTLHDNVMVGAGAVVLPRLTVGANTVIGAGTTVTRDLPANVVVVGNPARILKTI